MKRALLVTLRIVLALIVMGTLLVQLLIPFIVHGYGAIYWEVTPLVIPFAIVGIATVACFQVAVVAVWRLLSFVARDEVFSRRARSWVNVVMWSGAIAAVLAAGASAYLGLVAQIGGALVMLALVGAVVGGAAFVLLMLVMRGLLDSATADRDELAEVI